ncbi:MAG TPA: energy transducer TonB [Steroidobacteraceae bacterium]|nr:energy transducer TonB [Steroidobacteraceae bacterium]
MQSSAGWQHAAHADRHILKDMDLVQTKEGIAPVKDRLMTTLFLAGLFHGIVILGVSFGVRSLSNADSLPTLEVLLVSNGLPESPTNPDADYLSQRTQQGAGNTTESRRAESPQSSLFPIDNFGIPQGEALASQQAGLERASPEVLASSGRAPLAVHFADATEENTGPQQTALLMRAGPVSPVPSTDDSDQLVLKGKSERELVVTPNTRESDVAVYLDAWKRKVERVGTLNFPLEARRKGLSGSPVLEVAVAANGVMEDIVVRRSSGHAELDQAALAILKLSSPFDPFPRELHERHDSLRFAYEWQFIAGELVQSTVRTTATP